MSEQTARQNAELVRRFYEWSHDYRDGKWDHLELLAKTVVYRPIAEWPDAGECRGRDQYREFMASFWAGDAWEEIAFAATSHFGIGNKVITRLELAGRGRGSATETRARVFTVATLDLGRIVRLEDFTDRNEALAAAWSTAPVSANVETIRKSLELINSEGAKALPLLAWTWHPEIEWTASMAGAVDTQTYVGHDGMREYFDELFKSFPELSIEDREYSEVDDRVLALYTLRARGSQNAAEVVEPGASVWRFAGDKIVEGRGFLSHEEGIEAAGLS